MIEIEVEGTGVLQATGSGAPVTEESFLSSHCRTFDGRALAIIRPIAEGEIIVRAQIEGQDPVIRTIAVIDRAGSVDAQPVTGAK